MMVENVKRDAQGRHRQRSRMLVQTRHKKHRTSATTCLNHLQRQQCRGISFQRLYGVSERHANYGWHRESSSSFCCDDKGKSRRVASAYHEQDNVAVVFSSSSARNVWYADLPWKATSPIGILLFDHE